LNNLLSLNFMNFTLLVNLNKISPVMLPGCSVKHFVQPWLQKEVTHHPARLRTPSIGVIVNPFDKFTLKGEAGVKPV
jgi:hypothetical protein